MSTISGRFGSKGSMQHKTPEWGRRPWTRYIKLLLGGSGYQFGSIVPGSKHRHSHCDIIGIKLKEYTSRDEILTIGKRHVMSNKATSAADSRDKDPALLHGRELRNLQAIIEIAGPDLVPKLYGYNTARSILLMEDLGKYSLRDVIISAKESGQTLPALKQIVRAVARFDGVCTSNYNAFKNSDPRYVQERTIRKQGVFDLLERRVGLLQHDDNFSAKPYVDDLRELSQPFKLKDVFGHGDFNIEHVRAGITPNGIKPNLEDFMRVIDLEDFGIYSHVSDICDALLIKGVRTDEMIEDERFPELLDLYLALEHAYSHGFDDEKQIIKLVGCDQDGIRSYLINDAEIEGQYYADFILGFYAHAINKHIQFAVDQAPDQALYISQIEGMYHTLSSSRVIEDLFQHASDQDKAREHFYITGRLLTDAGIATINQKTLNAIKGTDAAPAGISRTLDLLTKR